MAFHRHSLFYRAVRNKIETVLVKEHGYSSVQALTAIDKISNDQIDDAATKSGVGAIGDGHILQWIKDHREQIYSVASLVITIILAV